ncbi:MAG TPA: ClpXP protease specificity-enhancing factor SspB [Thermodesulfovibrionales bacterium]|nr:ClpXP protease specificity-enhancing factor SspB [Thermodesulfovibrionales bacterium]
MDQKLNELKRKVFQEILDIVGRVFIVARHSEHVIIGKRGFTEEEKKDGIVLVFNVHMNFVWDESGISSTLVFGTTPQKCFVPAADIVAIYSPELQCQFISAPQISQEMPPSKDEKEKAGPNVVKVDFSKKKASRGSRTTRHGEGDTRGS